MIQRIVDALAGSAVGRWVMVALSLLGGGLLLERVVRGRGKKEGADLERAHQTIESARARAEAERLHRVTEETQRGFEAARDQRQRELDAKLAENAAAKAAALANPDLGTQDVRRWRERNDADEARLEQIKKEREK